MNTRELGLPFRVGATSYVIEDDLVPNARYLAERVQDMQLVLFDLPGGPSNLPDAETVDELRAIGRDRHLTYTVHLIENLRLYRPDGQPSSSVDRARQVIEKTGTLNPLGYVLHLDGKEFRQPNLYPATLARWQAETTDALSIVSGYAGDPALLAVENLESYPPDFVTPVVERLPVSRCVDLGHLWLDGHDPLLHLKSALPKTRIVHIHGVCGRDHQSLAHILPDDLCAIVSLLLDQRFAGVVTLEVFGLDDFEISLNAFVESVQRCRLSGQLSHR